MRLRKGVEACVLALLYEPMKSTYQFIFEGSRRRRIGPKPGALNHPTPTRNHPWRISQEEPAAPASQSLAR
jgi:hypothetical protein